MGGSSSSSPPPLFVTPWREISWGNNKDLKYMKHFKLQRKEGKHIRILIYGPVGSGKSSIINSVSNGLRGRITSPAQTSEMKENDPSFTKKYETHSIKKEGSTLYPFVFNDLMGLEDGRGRGVTVEDIKLAMKGHVMEGYEFNSASSLTSSDSSGYNSSPSLEDRVHVLVCVFSANATGINDSVLQKMKDVREAARKLGIPQVAFLTKIDQACPETEKDVKNVYKSKHLKKKMEDFSSQMGIPLNFIFPVKNYSEENDLNPDVDALIMNALKITADLGDDFLDKA